MKLDGDPCLLRSTHHVPRPLRLTDVVVERMNFIRPEGQHGAVALRSSSAVTCLPKGMHARDVDRHIFRDDSRGLVSTGSFALDDQELRLAVFPDQML